MPRRRRVQEFKRRLRKAIQHAEVQIEREDREERLLAVTADPLDDAFWRERENPDEYLCSCYSDLTEGAILADAREEIDAYLERSHA